MFFSNLLKFLIFVFYYINLFTFDEKLFTNSIISISFPFVIFILYI